MPKTMIRKRMKPRKKEKEPDIMQKLKNLTADAPVARIRGKSFVLVNDSKDDKH